MDDCPCNPLTATALEESAVSRGFWFGTGSVPTFTARLERATGTHKTRLREARVTASVGFFAVDFPQRRHAMDEIDNLMREASALLASGTSARQRGDETAAGERLRTALDLAVDAVSRVADRGSDPARLEILRTAALLALDCGEVKEARRLIEEAVAADNASSFADEWVRLRDVETWTDAWLVAAIRQDPPDEEALDVIVDRYWKPLFARCQMLTLDGEKARDLAQEACCGRGTTSSPGEISRDTS
jgi:hypothetical protein